MKFSPTIHSFLHAKYGLLCLALSVSGFAFSQTQELDKVEVISDSRERTLNDSPLRTLVISKQQLEKIHAKTLDDALRYVPGLSIKAIGGNAEDGSGLSIQGLDPSQVLIMVDGNPVAANSGDMVDVVDISQILVGNIDRIEIVKGGASAIYGARAMGGVVNLITQNPQESLRFSADLSVGNWGSISNKRPAAKDSSLLNISGGRGNFSLLASGSFINQKGYDTDADKAGTDGWHGYKNNFSTKLKYDFDTNNSLTISPTFYRAKTATHKQNTAHINKIMVENTSIRQRDTWDISYNGKINTLSYKVHLMSQAYDELIDTISKRLDQKSSNKRYQLKVQQAIGSDHIVNMSLEHSYEYLSQFDLANNKYEVDKKSKKSTDLSLSDSWFINQDFEFVPAIRINDDDFYNVLVSPMASLMYTNSNDWIDGRVNIRTSVSDSYTPPTLKEMHWLFDHGSLLYFGNPELKPERSLSTQLSFEFLTENNSRFELGLFNQDIKNLIDSAVDHERARQLPDVDSVYIYQNIDKSRIRGVNLSYSHSLGFIAISSGYSYLDAKNLDSGKHLPERPKDQIQLGLDFFSSEDTSLSLKYRYDAKQYVDFDNTQFVNAYDVFDAKFNQKLSHYFSWYLGIDNIFDNQPDKFTSTGGHGQSGNDLLPNAPRYVYLGIRINN